MSYGAGSLAITARRSGPRTVLERVHYDGISRCSRAFAEGDAARVVLSQLGPGVIRGDSVMTRGFVRADAHLIVTSQSATRLMGGPRGSSAHAMWDVADRAVLELVGEPLIASADARYQATTTITLGRDAVALLSDVAAVPTGAVVRLCTSIRGAERELLYDAFDAGAAAPHIIGTFAVVGIAPDHRPALVNALDAAADALPHLRFGVGQLTTGAFVRIIGDDVWNVRAALIVLRERARAVQRPARV